ncbi:hypothetical protein T05_3666 [Trichinella murrelli]|uniref:Uncharacterized protein n=1 Tax=Trichinella murrelli TaxID=144512 RepID=A0A0V0TJA9_9BILA|nr:hypothetical protein T05_5593 [Trichinella murrelli]KRX38631.1 hypothetical protein T05_3666 [Trichinella murrelli]
MRTSMVSVRSSHWSATGRLDKWGHSLSFTAACRIFPQILGRTSACIGSWLGWINRSDGMQMELDPTHPSLCSSIFVDSYQADHFMRTSKSQSVGHILPNEGALGAWVEEALYEHALTILAKGTRAHALEADLLSSTVCDQHAALRPGCLGCLVPGRRLRTVQKPVVTTPYPDTVHFHLTL